jgi:peptidoglycan/LPS O-acetylase OafA/YrhL
MAQTTRLYELDTLRGFAAVSVLLFHYTYKSNEMLSASIMDPAYGFKYGSYGVNLFFIISGFVIFLTINKVKSGTEFVYKRFIRLYPTFWICMLLTFVVTSIAGVERFNRTWSDLLYNITMVPGLFGRRPIDGAYWSLFPELLFYGLMLLIYYLNSLKKIEIIGYIWLISSLLIFYFHTPLKHFHLSVLSTLFNVNYCFLFLAGINFYKIWSIKPLEKQSLLANHIQIVFCLATCLLIKALGEFIITAVFFGVFYLFVYDKLKFLSKLKFMRFLGVISYALYLVHQFIGVIIIKQLYDLGIHNYFILLLIPSFISIFIGWLVTRYFENGLLRTIKGSLSPAALKRSESLV